MPPTYPNIHLYITQLYASAMGCISLHPSVSYIVFLVCSYWVIESNKYICCSYTQQIYNGDYTEKFPKPMFTTYFKTILFSIYLVAFLFWRPWQRACCNNYEYDRVEDEATSPLLHKVIPNYKDEVFNICDFSSR